MVKKFNAEIKYLIFCFCLISFSGKAQHPYFASLNQQLINTNPSFAGSNQKLRVQTNYGNFNPNFISNSVWYYASADVLIKKHCGLGLSFQNNYFEGGLFTQNQISLSYAHHFIIKDKIKIVPSFQVSYFQLRLDRTKMNFGEMIADHFGDGYNYNGNYWTVEEVYAYQTKQNMDFSAGLMIYKENYFFGASVLSFTQPDQGLMGVSKRPLTQIYQGGYNFKLKSHWTCNAYGFLKVQFHSTSFLQYGTYLGYSVFKLHLGHRINEGHVKEVLISGLNYSCAGFTFGYNATIDYTTDKNFFRSHELYLSMNFGNCKKQKTEQAASTVTSPIKLYY